MKCHVLSLSWCIKFNSRNRNLKMHICYGIINRNPVQIARKLKYLFDDKLARRRQLLTFKFKNIRMSCSMQFLFIFLHNQILTFITKFSLIIFYQFHMQLFTTLFSLNKRVSLHEIYFCRVLINIVRYGWNKIQTHSCQKLSLFNYTEL